MIVEPTRKFPNRFKVEFLHQYGALHNSETAPSVSLVTLMPFQAPSRDGHEYDG